MNWWEKLEEKSKRERFAQKVIQALRVAGIKGSIDYDAEKFQITLLRERESVDHMQMNLSNVYADYLAAPKPNRWRVIERFIRGTREFEMPKGFDEVRDHLVVRVRPRCYYTMLQLRFGKDRTQRRAVVHQPLGEHLAVGLAIDRKDGLIEVFSDMLTDWNLTVEEAFALGRVNLRRMSPSSLTALGPGLYCSPRGDNHDASRLALDDLVRDCEVKGDYVAMVPNRDTLLITGADDPYNLGAMLHVGEKMLRGKPRPMSGIPVRLRNGVWESFAPDEIYPELRQFRYLRVQSETQDYAEQKELLDASHARQEKNIFVATHSVLQHKETGEICSYTFWGDGLESLLPRAEIVFFMRANEEGPGGVLANAYWDRVCDVVGHRMKPTDDYPPRYFADTFPDEDELQRLGKQEIL